jgi:phage shock protein A
MSTVVKAKISRMLDRAEDPGETLDYGYQKQTELLQNVKKGIADVVTETMRARASAVEELEKAGAFDDITQLGSGEDDIDRQLSELTSGAQVDDELSKMKAELGTGGGDAPALEQGEDKA